MPADISSLLIYLRAAATSMLLWKKEENRDARDAFGDFLFLFYRAAGFLFSFQGQNCDESQSKSADMGLAEDISWILFS